ncbi:AraC family transcriptional regulator [Dyadobacter sp. 676]|uniref:AraC family transcriptional regulator n=1 Tax=Dyadobacter sp. 676 TaxID=3088362 RepID=A0AAU8FKF7_9BACT
MQISYQNKPLFPGKPALFPEGRRLYRHYEQSEQSLTTSIHWFDFQTNASHTLNVCYPSSFYKMVLCIEGNSRSMPRRAAQYGFGTGQALFYRTEEGPYQAVLPADTHFKVIHIHLSDAHTEMLQSNAPALFERPVPVMSLSAGCADAFLQLKALSDNPGLLNLFQEKLITDQLFRFASRVHTTGARARDILQEAIWHIHRSDSYLTISELSRLTGTNTFRIKQVFREQLHTSVFRYQSDLRLERAAQLLPDTGLDIAAIAFQCGYESAAAFSNAFLRKYGVRPSAFKNSRSRR